MVPVIGVGAVVVWNGRLLLIQRGNAPYRGTWCEPSGRLEPGETLEEGALRELTEEAGLSGRVVGPCGVAESVSADHHVMVHDFWVEVDDPDGAHPGDDATALAWVTRAELVALPLVPDLAAFLDRHGVLDRLLP
jgi:ADP-ribose pyrophosphatase YjhB (NUDIX family)